MTFWGTSVVVFEGRAEDTAIFATGGLVGN
jgi:hypothetical protein